jgi:hypothetical protein
MLVPGEALGRKHELAQNLVNTLRPNFLHQVVDSAQDIFKQIMSVFPLQNDIMDV